MSSMHMIRKGEYNIADCDGMAIADQVYALAGENRPE